MNLHTILYDIMLIRVFASPLFRTKRGHFLKVRRLGDDDDDVREADLNLISRLKCHTDCAVR